MPRKFQSFLAIEGFDRWVLVSGSRIQEGVSDFVRGRGSVKMVTGRRFVYVPSEAPVSRFR